MKRIILLCSFFCFSLLHAAETKLGIITSDIDRNETHFYVITSAAEEVEALRVETYLPSGQVSENDIYPIEEVINRGVILEERNGYQAVILKAADFSVTLGGSLELNYLYNGISGSRRKLMMELLPVGGEFALYRDGLPVNRLFLKGNYSRFFGLIGILDIRTSFVAQPSSFLLY